MIPQVEEILSREFEIVEPPTKTMKMQTDYDVIAGYVDNLEAMKQAVYIILSVERYDYLIHSWNFGVELRELFGQPVSYCIPEIKRRIQEALLQDSRITAVDNFNFDVNRGKVHTTFEVTTIFGSIESEKVVAIG